MLCVALFARHFKCSPEQLGAEHVRAYQQHLLARQVSWGQFNQAVCALRFLYNVTLGRPELIAHLPFAKRPRTLPTVLSPEEVMLFLDAALPGRDRTLLDVTYSCGLRLKELLGLQVADIDGARMREQFLGERAISNSVRIFECPFVPRPWCAPPGADTLTRWCRQRAHELGRTYKTLKQPIKVAAQPGGFTIKHIQIRPACVEAP